MAESRFNPVRLVLEYLHHNDTLIMETGTKVTCLCNLDKEAEDRNSRLLL